MTARTILSQAKLIKQSLDARRHQENDLFCEYNTNPVFWKLSELSILYPKLFEIVRWDWAYKDWNNGTGSSFYAPELRQYELIQRLLMYGEERRSACDIPEGEVFGKPVEGELDDVFVGRSGFIVVP